MTSPRRLIPGIAALVALIGGLFVPHALLQAWHIATVTCIQISLGCLFLTLLFQTTGGRWGEEIAPSLHRGLRLLPWTFLALIPALIFFPAVYHWEGETGDRALFLNRPFFTIRIAIYATVFGGMALLVSHGRQLRAGGLILFALVDYFLAIDLVMAIDPEWYSSGFPLVFMAGSALMGLATAILLQATSNSAPETKPWRDLGSLLLAMLVFWSYVSFTQFLIIWMGNLPEEIEWYVQRSAGGWKWVTILLAICNLFAPFFILLSRAVKDHPRRLSWVALLVLLSQVVYVHWLIAPSYSGRGAAGFHWLDPVVMIAALGLFFGILIRRKEDVSP